MMGDVELLTIRHARPFADLLEVIDQLLRCVGLQGQLLHHLEPVVTALMQEGGQVRLVGQGDLEDVPSCCELNCTACLLEHRLPLGHGLAHLVRDVERPDLLRRSVNDRNMWAFPSRSLRVFLGSGDFNRANLAAHLFGQLPNRIRQHLVVEGLHALAAYFEVKTGQTQTVSTLMCVFLI